MNAFPTLKTERLVLRDFHPSDGHWCILLGSGMMSESCIRTIPTSVPSKLIRIVKRLVTEHLALSRKPIQSYYFLILDKALDPFLRF